MPAFFVFSCLVGLLSPGDHKRIAQCKLRLRFGRDVQLLAFGHDLNRGRAATADSCADRRAFSATGNRADRRAETRSEGCALRRLSAAALPDLLVFGGCYGIWNPVDDNLCQLQTKFGRSLQASSTFDVRDTAPDVRAARNDFNPALRNRLLEYGDERLTNFVGFAVNAVDHPYDNFRPGRNSPGCIRGTGRR